MMPEFLKFLSKKMEEVSFTTLFLFLFGAALMVTGTTEKIAILGQSFVIKDEFRWIILVVGIVFILAGIAKERSLIDPEPPNNIPPLYTFHGLRSRLRSHALFQDFKINKASGTNRNAIYYMWADASVHNTIQSSIEHNNDDGSFLRIIFNNNAGWLSNVAIHPILEQALDNLSDDKLNLRYNFLKISDRIQRADEKDLDKIAIVLRVCDKNLTYWEYANRPGEFKQLLIETVSWKEKTVNLEDGGLWCKFESDGNHKNPATEPDFSVISGVVLVLGGYNIENQTPIFGKGVIDIHEISLSDPS